MAKLYFKYGAMGSSKTAQALITRFNYVERGMRVWLIKPATDNRDGCFRVTSRVGLSEECTPIYENDDIFNIFQSEHSYADVVIADESQFFTIEQIDQLRGIVNEYGIPVICFGLRTDFRTKLFPGSLRLFEVADTFHEIITMCACGKKATVNARLLGNKVVTDGEQIMIGGNESYLAMCHACYVKRIRGEKTNGN